MFGSGFKAFRPEVMGLLVHPFLISDRHRVSVFDGRLAQELPGPGLDGPAAFFGLYALSNASCLRKPG